MYKRVPSPASQSVNPNTIRGNPELQSVNPKEMYRYEDPMLESNMDTNRYLSSQYYSQRGSSMYSTLPSKKTQFFNSEVKTERSVTPDITRGLERNYNTNSIDRRIYYNPEMYEDNLKVNHQHSLPRNFYKTDQNLLNQKLGIPRTNSRYRHSDSSKCAFKIL
ncbi:hypothetical protein NQ314_018241 [Rhamnusium bicolor]|uniref:Uncharacterized protein n=1 Tax=Rhamnusium bicolor TaxID=1586634 RepID=A0AAV8WS70_9CUCU|nr:hypothetical protein NQ314_018241 [Rhamnusium bicolor]